MTYDSTACGFVVDSVAQYNIAENKRKSVATYRDYMIYKELDQSKKAQLMIMHMELEGAELEIQDLTAKLNDSEAKTKRLRGKRLWWSVGGVAVGALAYSILAK